MESQENKRRNKKRTTNVIHCINKLNKNHMTISTMQRKLLTKFNIHL